MSEVRAEVLRKQKAEMWFRYLQLADRLGYKIDWRRYRSWGSREELRHKRFGTWWREKGQAVFQETSRAEIRVIGTPGATVTVEIPAHWTVRRIHREIGPVVRAHLRRNPPEGVGEFVLTGRFSYSDFATYRRLLEIKLAAEGAGRNLSMKQMLAKLKSDEEARKARAARATDTSNKKAVLAGRKIGKTFRAVVVQKPEQRNGYIWIKKAMKIAENVAIGKFPGAKA